MAYGVIKDKTNRLMNDRTYAGKRYFDLFMMALVIGSVVLLIFEIDIRRKNIWVNPYIVDDVILIIFVIEYILRLWVCSGVRKDFKRAYRLRERNWLFRVLAGVYAIVRNKDKYMIRPMSIIDLLAILPVFRVFRAFRM